MWKSHGKLRITVELGSKVCDELVFDKKKVTIGRDPANDVVLPNQLVSGRHARVVRSDAGYIIEDLDSTNGTILNGRRVSREVLRVGAVATIGKYKLSLSQEGESAGTLPDAGATIVPRTDQTFELSPADADRLYADAALNSYVSKGGRLGVLTVTRGKGSPASLVLEQQKVVAGKESGVDIKLPGMLMPPVAFVVERTAKGYWLVPPLPAKKLKLNGEPVTGRKLLKGNETIEVGATALAFRFMS